MATSGGVSAVPSPLVLFSSSTAEPEKMASDPSQGMATGCSSQWSRSREVAWPQDMLPQSGPNGLCW
ncbi:hypothetical protein D3C85_1788780 [compost metagenome]